MKGPAAESHDLEDLAGFRQYRVGAADACKDAIRLPSKCAVYVDKRDPSNVTSKPDYVFNAGVQSSRVELECFVEQKVSAVEEVFALSGAFTVSAVTNGPPCGGEANRKIGYRMNRGGELKS